MKKCITNLRYPKIWCRHLQTVFEKSRNVIYSIIWPTSITLYCLGPFFYLATRKHKIKPSNPWYIILTRHHLLLCCCNDDQANISLLHFYKRLLHWKWVFVTWNQSVICQNKFMCGLNLFVWLLGVVFSMKKK